MATERSLDIDLGIRRLEGGDSGRVQRGVLEIETRKYYNGGLISSASVYWVGDHSRQQLMGIGSNEGDYSKRLLTSDRTVKATQKAIDRQHAEVFTPEVVARLTGYAKLHYSAVIEAGVDGHRNVYLPECTAAHVTFGGHCLNCGQNHSGVSA